MSYPKLIRLVQALRKKTDEGEIDWEETAQEGVYQANFGAHTLQVSSHNSDIKISIFNESGNEVESFTDESFRGMDVAHESIYKSMSTILETARRVALGSEQAIDSIIEILEDDGLPF